MSPSKGQASIEYILLIALIATIAYKGINQVVEIFFGWDAEQGAVDKMLDYNVKDKLSSDESGSNGF